MKRNMNRIYKGLVSGVLSFGMLCTGCSVPMAYAAGDISVYIDGDYLRTDVPPYIKNGYTMLPMRAVYENLGANVRYNSQSKEIIVSADGDVLKLYIGRKTAYLNGSPISLSVSPEIKNGRTMVGLRDGANLIGADIEWDSRTREISIWTDGDGYDDWYNDDDEYSFDDIKEGSWMDEWSQRAGLNIQKTGLNTAKVMVQWSSSYRETSEWVFNCKWDSNTGILTYKNGKSWECYYDDNTNNTYKELEYDDGSGYFYLDSGYLYWVDEKEDAGADCHFVWQG